MTNRDLCVGLLVLTSVSLAGCCCPRASTPSVADVPAARSTADFDGRQVFIDMTTVRIPAEHMAEALGHFRPTSEDQPKTLTAQEAADLLAKWQESADIQVVQAPKLLTIEGQESTISIGETIRFARTEVKGSGRSKTFETVEDKQSPVFVGYKLRLTALPSENGERIALDLTETAREMIKDVSGEDQARMGAEAFLRHATHEQKLELSFEIANDGYAMIGKPIVYEDDKGRFIRVSLLHAVLLEDNKTAKKLVN